MAKTLFTPQSLLIIAATIVALFAFNLTQPGPKNELQSSFDKWYAESAPALEAHDNGTYQGKEISVTVKSLHGGSASTSHEWKLPSSSLVDVEQRSRIARVLQLIAESQVFSIRSVSNLKPGGAYVTIAVADPTRKFETTVSYDDVKDNIQLQNLLKLLEVFAANPPAPPVNPAQL
jgi:hypothetical protein